MKGALVQFASTFGVSLPNLIVFQFNPETLRHSWTQATAAAGSHPLAVQGMPGESIQFTLSLDVTDQLADPDPGRVQIAKESGIYPRIAALEKLMFPVAAAPLAGGGAPAARGSAVPAAQLPTVLFVWGGGRVLPVRVGSLTITEKLFDANLNPTHADAVIDLRVLTPAELRAATGPLAELAKAAYEYSKSKRDLLSLVNLGDAASSVSLPPLPGL